MRSHASSFVAVLALACVLIASWVFVFEPLRDWRTATIEATYAAQTEYKKLLSAQAQMDRVEAQIKGGEFKGLFWTASQAGEAYALVQADLTRAAATAGITVRSMTPLPTQTNGSIESAVVRMEFEADLAKVTQFLRQIEYASPALTIKRGNLRRLLRANDTSEQPILFSQLDIAAPILVGDGS